MITLMEHVLLPGQFLDCGTLHELGQSNPFQKGKNLLAEIAP